ncbi:MAG: hypothetical protein ACOYMN_24715 [Roseimicrobium sp.]
MKTNPITCFSAVAAMLLLASCASPIARRVEHNPDLYNKLSERHKAMVQQGRVEEGMTKPAVFLAWGAPDRASKGSKFGRDFEQWSYAGYQAVQSLPYGGDWGRRAYRTGCYSYDRSMAFEPVFNYVPYEAARVEFLGGVVSAWTSAH